MTTPTLHPPSLMTQEHQKEKLTTTPQTTAGEVAMSPTVCGGQSASDRTGCLARAFCCYDPGFEDADGALER